MFVRAPMGLVSRIAIVFTVTFLLMLLTVAWIAYSILLTTHVELDRIDLEEQMERVTRAVGNRVEALEVKMRDWSAWTDTYKYVQGQHAEYEQENLQPLGLEAIRLNFLTFWDKRGGWVGGASTGLRDTKFLEGLAQLVSEHPEVVAQVVGEGTIISGLVRIGPETFAVTFQPILTNEQTGPPAGILFAGTLVSPEVLNAISEETSVAFAMMRVVPGNPQGPVARAVQGERATELLGETAMAGYVGFSDVFDSPFLVARIERGREAYQQGQRNVEFFLVLFAAAGVFCIGGAVLWLNLAVIHPVVRLSSWVRARAGRPAPPAPRPDSHEIEVLQADVMDAFASLDRARQEVEELNRDLESRVRARTAELNEANRELAHEVEVRREAESRLHEALKAKRSLAELQAKFISRASHEFRTPMAVIQGAVEVLRHQGGKLGEAKREAYFDRMEGAVERMVRLLDDVLTLNRARAGALVFKPRRIPLAAFCRDIVEEVSFAHNRSHPVRFWVAAADDTEAELDPDMLSSILTNLLDNAMKYSPPGTPVELALESREGWAILEFRDEGIGIPDEELNRLFEHFFRARNVGSVKGTGLGLSIVKWMVDLQGGLIRVQSHEGQGTTFRVELPLTASAVAPAEPRSPHSSGPLAAIR